MLHGGFTSVLESRSREELRDEVVRFATDLGFVTVSALTVVDHPLAPSEFFALDNSPEEFRDTQSDASIGRADPVMQHCKRQSVPIIWDQWTYVRQGQGPLWEQQARYGYCTGIAIALHLPDGKHFVLGVDRDKPVPTDSRELTRVVADLQLFAVMAQDAALRILTPPPAVTDTPALTPRELECLRWTMDGKTAWEVGIILGISERTAVLHVNNAMHKLGCVSKHQAVVKALRLGLIR